MLGKDDYDFPLDSEYIGLQSLSNHALVQFLRTSLRTAPVIHQYLSGEYRIP